MSEVAITRNGSMDRYEARIGDQLAGFAEYILAKNLIVFTHTEVQPAFEGQGVGGALAQFAVDDVRAHGARKILPLCPFIKAWLSRHPENNDLLYGAPASNVTD